MTEYTFTLQGHVDSWGEGTIELVTDGLLEKGEHLRKELQGPLEEVFQVLL